MIRQSTEKSLSQSTSSFLCAFSECRSPAFSDRSPSCTTIFKARRSRRNRPTFRFPDSGRERAWKPENDLPPFSPLSSGFFHTVENAWRESSRFHEKTRKFSASLRLCGRTARGCWYRKRQEKQAIFAQRRRGAEKSLLNPAAKQEFRSISGGVRKSDLSLRVHRCESVVQCSWVAACRAVCSVPL